jgi:hypothetical protein
LNSRAQPTVQARNDQDEIKFITLLIITDKKTIQLFKGNKKKKKKATNPSKHWGRRKI